MPIRSIGRHTHTTPDIPQPSDETPQLKTSLPLLLAGGLLVTCPTLLMESSAPPKHTVLDLPPAIGAADDWWVRASDAIARSASEATQTQDLRSWFNYDGAEVKASAIKPSGEWVWKWRLLAGGVPDPSTEREPAL